MGISTSYKSNFFRAAPGILFEDGVERNLDIMGLLESIIFRKPGNRRLFTELKL